MCGIFMKNLIMSKLIEIESRLVLVQEEIDTEQNKRWIENEREFCGNQ